MRNDLNRPVVDKHCNNCIVPIHCIQGKVSIGSFTKTIFKVIRNEATRRPLVHVTLYIPEKICKTN
jgi:hypothetical protein